MRFHFNFFCDRLIASGGKLPRSLEPRNLIEQLAPRAFNTNASTQFELAASIIFIGPTSFKDHRHQGVGFREGTLHCHVFDEVGPGLDCFKVVLVKVLIRIAPGLEVPNGTTRGFSSEGLRVTRSELVKINLASFEGADKAGHGQLNPRSLSFMMMQFPQE